MLFGNLSLTEICENVLEMKYNVEAMNAMSVWLMEIETAIFYPYQVQGA